MAYTIMRTCKEEEWWSRGRWWSSPGRGRWWSSPTRGRWWFVSTWGLLIGLICKWCNSKMVDLHVKEGHYVAMVTRSEVFLRFWLVTHQIQKQQIQEQLTVWNGLMVCIVWIVQTSKPRLWKSMRDFGNLKLGGKLVLNTCNNNDNSSSDCPE